MRAARRERRRRAAQHREGVVLLIVLLIVMMATGTAMFALNATNGEQRVAGQLVEGAWTVCIAEGATMSGVADVETDNRQSATGVDQRWVGVNSVFTQRYGVAAPTVSPTTRSFDAAEDAARFPVALFPLGPTGFAPALRSGLAPFQAPSPSLRVADFRSLARVWSVPTQGGQTRTRAEITGFGETRIASDATDLFPLPGNGAATAGQRGLYTTVSMVRAYVDRIE